MFKKKKEELVEEVVVEETIPVQENPTVKINNIKEEVVELPIEEVTL